MNPTEAGASQRLFGSAGAGEEGEYRRSHLTAAAGRTNDPLSHIFTASTSSRLLTSTLPRTFLTPGPEDAGAATRRAGGGAKGERRDTLDVDTDALECFCFFRLALADAGMQCCEGPLSPHQQPG